MSHFNDILAAGLRSISRLAGSPMLYHAGDVVVPLPSVVEGQTRYQREDENGVTITATAIDFMFAAADLVHEGEPIEPSPRHWLEKLSSIDGVPSRKFRVLPLGDEPCYRYADPNHTEYRVHTKEGLEAVD